MLSSLAAANLAFVDDDYSLNLSLMDCSIAGLLLALKN